MSSQDTALAGREVVAADLIAIGASVTGKSRGNRRWLVAGWPDGSFWQVTVSTRTGGTWQSNTHVADQEAVDDDTMLWAFADLSTSPPVVYVSTRAAVQRDIHRHHSDWLARHGYATREDRASTHHAISLSRVTAMHTGWPIDTGTPGERLDA